MFGVEFRYFSNSLGQNQILFECFGARSTIFRNVCLQIQYFSNNIRINSILFECSELKSDTFRVFRVEIPYFLNVWAKRTHFWNSLVSNTIFMNFLLYNNDIFQTFCIWMYLFWNSHIWRSWTVRSFYASCDHIISISLKLMTWRTFWIPIMWVESA